MRLTMKDKQRIEVIQAVMDKRIEIEDARRVLSRSRRQIYRMLKRLRQMGISGLIHGNRGRSSPKKLKGVLVEKIVTLAQGRLKGINDTHLKEILAREEGIHIGRETLRAILRGSQIKPKQKRRSPKYRCRRERKEAFGMMLQIDGSPHDWLEGRGPEMTLIGGIDDATGHVWAHFEDQETTWAYLNLMEGILSSHGLPLSLYADRHSIFYVSKEPTIVEQLKNQIPLTQFGRAMEELGIRIIPAWSAPAKGRIERLWRTFQDRLIVEMRLAGIKTQEEANRFLERFLKEHNHRFTVSPRKKESVFRKAPSPTKRYRILCLKETRTVNKDHTISFEGLILQIPPSKKFRSLAKRKVNVLQLKDGSIEIAYKQMTVARFSPEAVNRLIKHHKTQRSLFRHAA